MHVLLLHARTRAHIGHLTHVAMLTATRTCARLICDLTRVAEVQCGVCRECFLHA